MTAQTFPYAETVHRLEDRDRMSLKVALGVVAIVVVPILYGLIGINGVAYRDDLDVYGRFVSSPLDLLLPLAAVFLTCVGTYYELGNRFVANLRTRTDIRRFLRHRLVMVVAISFVLTPTENRATSAN
jgi:uncharacterized sodium:solute symporter family permease YidK